jgi:hypothetical protein
MKKLGGCRIFADHYQFYLLDSKADPFENIPEWSEDTVKLGYVANEKVLQIKTYAHLNDHWVDVFLSDSTPAKNGAEKVLTVDLLIESGRLLIMSPIDIDDEIYSVQVPAGKYTVHVFVRNIGRDKFTQDGITETEDDELTDNEIEARDDLERYEIVLTMPLEQTA